MASKTYTRLQEEQERDRQLKLAIKKGATESDLDRLFDEDAQPVQDMGIGWS